MIWCDNCAENQTPLQRNGMAAIPKSKTDKENTSLPIGAVFVNLKLLIRIVLQKAR